MTDFTPRSQPIRLTSKGHQAFHLPADALSMLIKKGVFKDLWQSPRFMQAHQQSEYLLQSAKRLKKYLPEHYHHCVRFTQNPNTWVLNIKEKAHFAALSASLNTSYAVMHDDNQLPQYIKVRQVYRHWEDSGQLLSEMIDFSHKPHIQRLQQSIAEQLHPHIRLQYQPSVWQLNVENAAIYSRLNPLLDQLSMSLAKDMGFAVKLRLSVVPDTWESSGLMLTELIKEKIQLPSEEEADAYLKTFLSDEPPR